jgi:hypothetical protein
MEDKPSRKKKTQVNADQDVPGIEDDLLRFENRACTVFAWVSGHLVLLCHAVAIILGMGLSGGIFNSDIQQKIIYVVTITNSAAAGITYSQKIIQKLLKVNLQKRKRLVANASINV